MKFLILQNTKEDIVKNVSTRFAYTLIVNNFQNNIGPH